MSGQEQPWTFGDARDADREASANQRAAERFIIDCAKGYAECERAYREALATKILALKAEGTAWTSCGDIARGLPSVAALKLKRDVADGMREAAVQAAWRASKDRDAILKFIAWSERREMAETYNPPQEQGGTSYPARRAA